MKRGKKGRSVFVLSETIMLATLLLLSMFSGNGHTRASSMQAAGMLGTPVYVIEKGVVAPGKELELFANCPDPLEIKTGWLEVKAFQNGKEIPIYEGRDYLQHNAENTFRPGWEGKVYSTGDRKLTLSVTLTAVCVPRS
jgi:hypothetical protein